MGQDKCRLRNTGRPEQWARDVSAGGVESGDEDAERSDAPMAGGTKVTEATTPSSSSTISY